MGLEEAVKMSNCGGYGERSRSAFGMCGLLPVCCGFVYRDYEKKPDKTVQYITKISVLERYDFVLFRSSFEAKKRLKRWREKAHTHYFLFCTS